MRRAGVRQNALSINPRPEEPANRRQHHKLKQPDDYAWSDLRRRDARRDGYGLPVHTAGTYSLYAPTRWSRRERARSTQAAVRSNNQP